MSEPRLFTAVPGVVIAQVIDVNDPEGLARVRLHYPTLGVDSDWARLGTPYAGGENGIHFVPEVDDELAVVFRDGDIDRPRVVGGLWSLPALPPPGAGADENARKLIQTRSAHRLRIDDGEEQGELHLETSDRKHRITIDTAADTIRIEGDTGDVRVSAPGGTVRLEAKTVSARATESIAVQAGKALSVSSGKVTDLKAVEQLTAKALQGAVAIGGLKAEGGQRMTLKGAMLGLNQGSAAGAAGPQSLAKAMTKATDVTGGFPMGLDVGALGGDLLNDLAGKMSDLVGGLLGELGEFVLDKLGAFGDVMECLVDNVISKIPAVRDALGLADQFLTNTIERALYGWDIPKVWEVERIDHPNQPGDDFTIAADDWVLIRGTPGGLVKTLTLDADTPRPTLDLRRPDAEFSGLIGSIAEARAPFVLQVQGDSGPLPLEALLSRGRIQARGRGVEKEYRSGGDRLRAFYDDLRAEEGFLPELRSEEGQPTLVLALDDDAARDYSWTSTWTWTVYCRADYWPAASSFGAAKGLKGWADEGKLKWSPGCRPLDNPAGYICLTYGMIRPSSYLPTTRLDGKPFHQGDGERAMVLLPVSEVGGAARVGTVSHVVITGHGKGALIDASSVEFRGEGRPVIRIALGAHATGVGGGLYTWGAAEMGLSMMERFPLGVDDPASEGEAPQVELHGATEDGEHFVNATAVYGGHVRWGDPSWTGLNKAMALFGSEKGYTSWGRGAKLWDTNSVLRSWSGEEFLAQRE